VLTVSVVPETGIQTTMNDSLKDGEQQTFIGGITERIFLQLQRLKSPALNGFIAQRPVD